MNDAGWADLWHVAGTMLVRQLPFVQILAVTFAALFVVMAIEGFRTSMIAIWRSHRFPAATAPGGGRGAEERPVAGIAKSFLFRPASLPAPRRKVLTESPRQFRSPRPVIRRHPASVPDASSQHPTDISEDVSPAV
jgi:hypothetical protein